MVVEEKVFKCRQSILLSRYYPSFETGVSLHWNHFNLFIQGCYELKLVEISTAVLEEKIFLKCRQCIFAIVLLSLPGKGGDTSFEHLNPHLRMFVCLKLVQPLWRIILNVYNLFLLFLYNFTLEKGVMALNFDKIECPSLKDFFESSFDEISPVILKKR